MTLISDNTKTIGIVPDFTTVIKAIKKSPKTKKVDDDDDSILEGM